MVQAKKIKHFLYHMIKPLILNRKNWFNWNYCTIRWQQIHIVVVLEHPWIISLIMVISHKQSFHWQCMKLFELKYALHSLKFSHDDHFKTTLYQKCCNILHHEACITITCISHICILKMKGTLSEYTQQRLQQCSNFKATVYRKCTKWLDTLLVNKAAACESTLRLLISWNINFDFITTGCRLEEALCFQKD